MTEYEEGHNIPDIDLVEMQNVLDSERAKVRELEAQNAVLREALERIATTLFQQYDGNKPFVSDHDSGYAMGVADGHRLAAKWANEALSITTQEAAEMFRKKEADKNQAYSERNILVCLLASMYPSGIAKTKIDGWDVEWEGCVYIDFPWGQASWHYHDSQAHLFEHLPEYRNGYDGHTTEDKYNRIIEAAHAAGMEVEG